MLKNIKGDLEGKQYAAKARSITHYDESLLKTVKKALNQKNPLAAEGIRSVVRSQSTAIIRARSRSAMSELYIEKQSILKTLLEEGISSLRFTV